MNPTHECDCSHHHILDEEFCEWCGTAIKPINNMIYIGIDPGHVQTAIVTGPLDKPTPIGIIPNEDIFATLYSLCPESVETRIGVEMIASYGMPVGREVFETCLFIGRMIEFLTSSCTDREQIKCVYRKDVKMHLCNSNRAKDSNVSQAIKDLYPRTGGGKDPAKGTKTQPGPLYGFKADLWAALGVAITAKENWNQLNRFPL